MDRKAGSLSFTGLKNAGGFKVSSMLIIKPVLLRVFERPDPINAMWVLVCVFEL